MSPTPEPDNALLEFREAIRAEALRLGFARTGFTTADPLPEAQQRRWERWRAEGKAGVMEYLLREAPRRTHPRDLLPEARTAIVTLAAYYDGDHGAPPEGEGAAGKVARYAWGRDYHLVLREKLNALGEWIAAHADPGSDNPQSAIRNPQSEAGEDARAPGINPQSALDSPLIRNPQSAIRNSITWRPCVDSAPLDERALAVRAGLGFIGKNTLLLDPERGSWALIGVLLLSLELPPDGPLKASGIHGCGACRRCIEACPTGALEDAWRMDPRKCISYLTIEQREELAPELNAQRGAWAFGCDRCQEVCPFNERPLRRVMDQLGRAEGAGPWLSETRLRAFPSGKAFLRAWGHTPLARPGLRHVLRNVTSIRLMP